MPKAGAKLTIRRLTPSRVPDLGRVTSGTWGSGCWCIFPRLTAADEKTLPGPGGISVRRRREMTRLAGRKRAPGLLAYLDGEVAGWVAIAPRKELRRVDASKATPPVDGVAVWVIPCVTVFHKARGRGVALALIRAAVAYARKEGAPAVEAYARAGMKRVHDEHAFHGTERMFRRAGFEAVRGRLKDLPKGWTPRVTMRMTFRGGSTAHV